MWYIFRRLLPRGHVIITTHFRFGMFLPLPLTISLLISLETSELITPEVLSTTCRVSGNVKDASCGYNTIDEVNDQLSPLLNALVERKFFRYYKVNLHKTCSLWNANMKCNRPDCAVEEVADLVSDLL
jgi:hypothetical protein